MFNKGDTVVQILRGGGVETASLRTVSKVTLDDDDEPTFDLNGRELEPSFIAGFSKRLVVLEGEVGH